MSYGNYTLLFLENVFMYQLYIDNGCIDRTYCDNRVFFRL